MSDVRSVPRLSVIAYLEALPVAEAKAKAEAEEEHLECESESRLAVSRQTVTTEVSSASSSVH